MLKKIFIFYFLIFSNLIFSQSEKWKINKDKSHVSYSGNHILHSWEGLNKNVFGLFVVNSDLNISDIAIILKVEDFDSGNPNRDSHALEILESLKYPQIRFYSNDLSVIKDEIEITGKLTFFEKNIQKLINSKIEIFDNKIVLTGNFDLILSDFGVKLPSFLGVKIEDLIKISYKIEVNKDKI
jgi:polyisoprenoid-binding protein YceI